MRNYHLFYPHLLKKCDHAQAGDAIDLGNRRLELKKAIIHDLPNTLWIYEPDIGFLCVGDGYPYTHDHEHGQCAMTSEELPSPIRPEDTSIVISRALNWAKYVDAGDMMGELRAFLRDHPVHFVGPSHGGVITNVTEITDIMDTGLARAKGLP
jgi:flavorubredoxin